MEEVKKIYEAVRDAFDAIESSSLSRDDLNELDILDLYNELEYSTRFLKEYIENN